jgi:hypothetical protein
MNICIVGNGQSALYKNNGNFIDSCDIVIRMGNFNIKGYESCVGSKIDIYCSRWYKAKHKSYDLFSNIKEMWIPRTYETREKKYDNLIMNFNVLNKIMYIPLHLIYKYKIKFPYKLSNQLNNSKTSNKDLNCSLPDSGIIAIDMALIKFPNSKIYISGFDNCATDSHYWDKSSVIDKLSNEMLNLQKLYLKDYMHKQKIFDLCDSL